MTKRIREKEGYAGILIARWWMCVYVAIPAVGGSLLFNSNNVQTEDNGSLPVWLAVLGYAAACIFQYLYNRYSPVVQQANRISRKFLWWKRGTTISIHGMSLAFFLMPYHQDSSTGVLAVIVLSAIVLLIPIWMKDLTNQIKL